MAEKMKPGVEGNWLKNKMKENRVALLGILASVGFHAAAPFALSKDLRDDAREKITNTQRLTREKFNDIFGSEKEGEFQEKLKSERGVDQGAFFIKSETFHGTTEEEAVEALKRLEEIRKMYADKFKETRTLKDELGLATELLKEKGRYNPTSTFLTDSLNKHEGNCEAGTKFVISTVPFIFPESKIKTQWFAGDEKTPPHVRPIVQMRDGKWYAFEKFPTEVTSKEIDGSVITDTDVFLKAYKGEAISGQQVPGENSQHGKSSLKTNTFFSPHFEQQPTRVFGGGSAKRETEEEYKAYKQETYEQLSESKSDRIEVRLVTPEEAQRLIHPEIKKSSKESENKVQVKQLTEEEIVKAKVEGKLSIFFNRLYDRVDVAPLSNVPLREIAIDASGVENLDTLNVSDVEVLKLHFTETKNFKQGAINLEKFRGAKLKTLVIIAPEILDITPLKDTMFNGSFTMYGKEYLDQLALFANVDFLGYDCPSVKPSIISEDEKKGIQKINHLKKLGFYNLDLSTADFNFLASTEIEELTVETFGKKMSQEALQDIAASKVTSLEISNTLIDNLAPLAKSNVTSLSLHYTYFPKKALPTFDLRPLREKIMAGELVIYTGDSKINEVNYQDWYDPNP